MKRVKVSPPTCATRLINENGQLFAWLPNGRIQIYNPKRGAWVNAIDIAKQSASVAHIYDALRRDYGGDDDI